MKFQVRIKKNGEKETIVLDREQQNCSGIKQFTAALGEERSDEITGPECDTAEEQVIPV